MAVNRASAAGNPPAWLNVGCIPSKALLHSSVAAVAAAYGLAWHHAGMRLPERAQAMLRKRRVVDRIQRQCAYGIIR